MPRKYNVPRLDRLGEVLKPVVKHGLESHSLPPRHPLIGLLVSKGATGDVVEDEAQLGNRVDGVAVVGGNNDGAHGILKIEVSVPLRVLVDLRQRDSGWLAEQRHPEEIEALHPVSFVSRHAQGPAGNGSALHDPVVEAPGKVPAGIPHLLALDLVMGL